MTVAAVVTETVYALAGAAVGPFNTVWPYAEDADVGVWLDLADGEGLQLLSPDGDYTLADVVPTLTNGGNVTLAAELAGAGWPANARLAIVRSGTDDQPSAFGEALSFNTAAAETALDHVVRKLQELDSKLARALLMPPGQAGFTFPQAPLLAGGPYVLGFDPTTGAPALYLLATSEQAATPFPELAAPPPLPSWGTTYLDTTLNAARIYLGGQWYDFTLNA